MRHHLSGGGVICLVEEGWCGGWDFQPPPVWWGPLNPGTPTRQGPKPCTSNPGAPHPDSGGRGGTGLTRLGNPRTAQSRGVVPRPGLPPCRPPARALNPGLRGSLPASLWGAGLESPQ